MNAQELMKPRFEVIAVYPFCPYKVGDVIESDHETLHQTTTSHRDEFGDICNVAHYVPIKDFEQYPHLFRKLNWWDKRNIEDMPTYIKSETQVVKPDWQLEEWMGNKYLRAYDSSAKKYNMSVSFKLQSFEPATEQEYLEFVKKK